MKLLWVVATALLVIGPLHAAQSEHPDAAVVVKKVTSTAVTASGQPITLPQKDVHVVVSTFDNPAARTCPTIPTRPGLTSTCRRERCA